VYLQVLHHPRLVPPHLLLLLLRHPVPVLPRLVDNPLHHLLLRVYLQGHPAALYSQLVLVLLVV
jgi:hypothetical protein